VGGWFDSHCHVQEEYVGGDDEGGPAGAGEVQAVLARAAGAGVDQLICIGTGRATSE
jgi:Tat protein secretion system quality control protein TatD with DNase activity